MENLKGLEKYLNEGCFIIVSKGLSQQRKVVASILKEIRGTRKIVAQTENFNILSTLNKLSLDKIEPDANLYKKLKACHHENILMDELLQSYDVSYSLHLYRLSNKQYLSTICVRSSNGEYIPLQSIITDTILTGIQILNETLNRIKREHRLQQFIEYPYFGFRSNFKRENSSYVAAVEEAMSHQKTIGEKK